MENFVPTPRTAVRRLPKRACYDVETVHSILDEGLVCHVGIAVDGQPFVIPTIHARIEDRVYFHGSTASRALRAMAAGAPACVTVTLLDGLVLARSAFHHSMNYRSVVILGTASEVTDEKEKLRALEAIVEHVVPGRSSATRPPSPKEMKATLVLRMPLVEVSAKIRTGPPVDEEEDYALPFWAGVLPLRLVPQEPVRDPRVDPGVALPEHVAAYRL